MGLVVIDIFYHICPSKVRAYNNSKGDCCKFVSQLFYVVLLIVCGYKGRGNSAARVSMTLVDIITYQFITCVYHILCSASW